MDIKGYNVPELYTECLWKMKVMMVGELSRNGPVMTMPTPTMLELKNPMERMLFDPVRKANPFFHLMEFVWIMSGSNDVRFIEQFNQRYRQYAEPNDNKVWGAYGFRWRHHFNVDQIERVVEMLRTDPTSRRAVLAMWCPADDLEYHEDLPCNTHIYLRVVRDNLDMLVCNRSNDLIWGALGANVVCFTMLQELLAKAIDMEVGTYRVMSNNLHIYREMPNFDKIWNTFGKVDYYEREDLKTYPLLSRSETIYDFIGDAVTMVGGGNAFYTDWFNEVAVHVKDVYLRRKRNQPYDITLKNIGAPDVQRACELWIQYKDEEKKHEERNR